MSNNMIVKVVDEATPFLQLVGKENPNYIRKGIKSAGWWIRKEIAAGIESGAPGGQPYAPPSSITVNRTFDSIRNRGRTKTGRWRRPRKLKTRKNQLGRLKQAARYKFYSDSSRVIVGWVSKSAERLGMLHEKGGEVQVTARMRRFYWAAGIPIGSKTSIHIPARPTIGPEYRENAPQIPDYVERKIWDYMEEAAKKAAIKAQVNG